jgi:DNA-binding transcriptional LysR family regulator
MILAMELRRLRYFLAVAEELHFTRAATRVHIAQPALSQQIRELEVDLGTKLFARTKRSVRLTDAGKVLLPEARRILAQVDAAVRAVKRSGDGEVGSLTVGMTLSAAGVLVPRAVNTYRSRYPHVDVHLRVLTTGTQLRQLLDDELDVGLIRDVVVPAGIARQRLRREEIVVGLHRGHRLAKRPRIALAELAEEPFVLGPAQSAQSTDLIFAACAEAGFAPRVVEQPTDMIATLVLGAAGVGVTLMPRSSGHLESPDIVYRPIRGRRVTLDLYVAWRRDRASAMTTQFVEVLRAVGGAA